MAARVAEHGVAPRQSVGFCTLLDQVCLPIRQETLTLPGCRHIQGWTVSEQVSTGRASVDTWRSAFHCDLSRSSPWHANRCM